MSIISIRSRNGSGMVSSTLAVQINRTCNKVKSLPPNNQADCEKDMNSHIQHSRAGHALLRWRKECRRLWVLLGSAVQPPIHSVACALILIKFLPVISSVMITCTYPFTEDDNYLQKSTILGDMPLYSPQQSLHQLKFDQVCPKIWPWNPMELLRFKAAILYLCSQYILYHLTCNVDCQNCIKYTTKASHDI